jgi:hypothetical protein
MAIPLSIGCVFYSASTYFVRSHKHEDNSGRIAWWMGVDPYFYP